MTSTGDIAHFARITMPMVYRQWPEELGGTWPDKKKKKKKPHKQPQVDESAWDLPGRKPVRGGEAVIKCPGCGRPHHGGFDSEFCGPKCAWEAEVAKEDAIKARSTGAPTAMS